MSRVLQPAGPAGVTGPRSAGMGAAVRRACAVAALVACGTSAHAGIFDDDEARCVIIDLRTRISQLEDSSKSQNAQNAQQLQQLQNALLDLTNQNEQLRQQIAQLRGMPAFEVAAVLAYVGAAGHLGAGRRAHRTRQRGRQPVHAAATAGPIKAKKDPPAERLSGQSECPVLPSGRGVRRQHGATHVYR